MCLPLRPRLSIQGETFGSDEEDDTASRREPEMRRFPDTVSTITVIFPIRSEVGAARTFDLLADWWNEHCGQTPTADVGCNLDG